MGSCIVYWGETRSPAALRFPLFHTSWKIRRISAVFPDGIHRLLPKVGQAYIHRFSLARARRRASLMGESQRLVLRGHRSPGRTSETPEFPHFEARGAFSRAR